MLGYETERYRVDVGDYALDLFVLRPHGQHGPVPGVLWIHGGGYMLGMAGMAHASRMAPLVRSGEAVVVSPRYRLAWRKPYPAAVLDCYAALLWLQEHAQELGCAPDQLFVGGESAGGGLAAATCLLARDIGEVAVAFQMPLYPMLDCRDTRTSADNHGRVWNTARNHWGWQGYLGPLWGSQAVPAYASPAWADDLSGMPPAFTFVSDGETFLAETLDYVRALEAAGVDAACDVYHGDVHAFDMLTPWTAEARAAIARFEERFRQAAETCRAAQPRR